MLNWKRNEKFMFAGTLIAIFLILIFSVIFIKGVSHTPGKDDVAVFGKFAISRPPVNYDLYNKDNSKTVLENVTGYYESSDSQVYVQNNSDFVVINKGESYEKKSQKIASENDRKMLSRIKKFEEE
ncbi:hypothetical protein [Bacillus siamensis]|uniref:hypothetical protein n=1 Tax=Bacillus siamensis TaxID=659243 RepID=UPI0005F987AF|nr:hypothetical protein [Bacillus siamensis]